MSDKNKNKFIQTPRCTDFSEYNKLLFGEQEAELPSTCERAKEAFKLAHDIRKFEIDLYWKRASHFWIFLSFVLGGFGVTMLQTYKDFISPDFKNSEYLFFIAICLLVLSALGTIISWIWIYVMKGSKFWQENWEQHINMLEEPFTGNLHRTIYIKSPIHYSVSSLSQVVGWVFFISCSLAYLYSIGRLSREVNRACYCKVALVIVLVSLMVGVLAGIWYMCKRDSKEMEAGKKERTDSKSVP